MTQSWSFQQWCSDVCSTNSVNLSCLYSSEGKLWTYKVTKLVVWTRLVFAWTVTYVFGPWLPRNSVARQTSWWYIMMHIHYNYIALQIHYGDHLNITICIKCIVHIHSYGYLLYNIMVINGGVYSKGWTWNRQMPIQVICKMSGMPSDWGLKQSNTLYYSSRQWLYM